LVQSKCEVCLPACRPLYPTTNRVNLSLTCVEASSLQQDVFPTTGCLTPTLQLTYPHPYAVQVDIGFDHPDSLAARQIWILSDHLLPGSELLATRAAGFRDWIEWNAT